MNDTSKLPSEAIEDLTKESGEILEKIKITDFILISAVSL